MNRGELRNYLRRYLREAGTGQFDDAIMNTELSRAARGLAGEFGLILTEATGTTDEDGRLVIPGLVNVAGPVRIGTTTMALPIWTAGDVYGDPQGWAATGAPRALVVDEGYLGPGVVGLWPVAEGTTVTLTAFVDGGVMATDTDIPWGGRYDVYHDVIAYHAAHALMAHNGARGAQEPVWMQRYQLRMEELRDRGSAGSLLGHTRMGSILPRRRTWEW